MAYFAIWRHEVEDKLFVARFTTKEYLYEWLALRDDDADYVGFLSFDTTPQYERESMMVTDIYRGNVLVIKGEAIQPTRKKVKVVEWWAE